MKHHLLLMLLHLLLNVCHSEVQHGGFRCIVFVLWSEDHGGISIEFLRWGNNSTHDPHCMRRGTALCIDGHGHVDHSLHLGILFNQRLHFILASNKRSGFA